MSDHIVERWLEEAERKYRIDIVYAYIGGSQQFGYADKKSDWDVFYIYIGKPEKIYDRSTYNNYKLTYTGINLNDVDLTNHWLVDAFKEAKVFRNKYGYRDTVIAQLDDLDKDALKVSIRKIVRIMRNNIRDGNKRVKKYYILGILHILRLKWIRDYDNLDYPVRMRALLNHYSDETWYDDVVAMLRTRRKTFLTINTKLFNILNNEINS